MKINLLKPSVYNRISAGEVVDRPASIVKEIVENSIDAGAKNIRIEIEQGGIRNITVSDDGCGIEKEDLPIAFLPHATSKISKAEDLDDIQSLGFRGEALASISSVCQVDLSSKTENSSIGYSIKVYGGEESEIKEIARSKGTTISCSNLFFNTPVRAKFLRKPKTEEAEITHLVERLMLSFSDISFQYYVDGKQIYNTKSCSMSEIIYTIYGQEVFDNLINVDYRSGDYWVHGYITKPTLSKSNRTYQTLFVNNRYVENNLISSCISNVYSSFLMKGRFPLYVLCLDVPAGNVDVNVHPSKREVRFDNPNKIYGIVSRGVENALLSADQLQTFSIHTDDSDEKEEEDKYLFKQNESNEELIQKYLGKDTIQIKERISPITGGKSYFVDLFDPNEKLKFPERRIKEVDVENVNIKDNVTLSKASALDKDLKELENLSIKKNEVSSSQNSNISFEMSKDKFFNQIVRESPSFLTANVKDEMKILGTIFKTYIAIEFNDCLYFIDQHAAHERLLFDKLVKHIDAGNNIAQPLISPYSFKVGAKESQYIDNISPSLKRMGFEISRLGNLYTINTVPLLLTDINLEQFVENILSDKMLLEGKASDFIHSKLCQTACKHAIKAGDSISKDECAYIIEEVRKGVMLCPHGRPITLVLNKHEFEKMFKRVL